MNWKETETILQQKKVEVIGPILNGSDEGFCSTSSSMSEIACPLSLKKKDATEHDDA